MTRPPASHPSATSAILNRPPHDLPARCDVLVVGAGPAGSAAALVLTRAGFDVVLVDQQAFPRDKVCGDGLIPDAHHALRRLGLLDEVLAQACSVGHVTATAPRAGRLDVPGTLAVLPRRQLDLILCRAAAQAGARMHAPLRFVAPIEGPPAPGAAGPAPVIGARLAAGGQERELLADWIVLASGAVPQALLAAGLCTRRTPSAVALRGYVRNAAMAGRITTLQVTWHPSLRNGYGWIFPCGDGLFNVGVGVVHRHPRDGDDGSSRAAMGEVDLRAMLRSFTAVDPVAAELVSGGEWVGRVKGAPLRFSLAGADWSRPGLLVTGEAAGTTYAVTGEGIGKALETGMLAAETIAQGRREGWGDAVLRARYEQGVLALKPRYRVYERASAVNRLPWLVDLLVWSARRSPSRLRRMSAVLEETHLPRHPLSAAGLFRLLFERG